MIFAAQRFRCRPSEMLRIDDGFAAFCFDEACSFILSQWEEGKRPFFGRDGDDRSDNAGTVALLKDLGAEVIHYDQRGNCGGLS